MKKIIIILVALALLGFGASLLMNKDNTANDTGTPLANGRVIFTVTDAAADMGNVSEISMTVNKVEIHSEAEGWITVDSTNRTFDLLELKANDELALAGDATITAGTYNQMRVAVEKIVVTTKDDKTFEAKLPSGELKINSAIVVEENQTSTVNLDFIADASLHMTGQGGYIFAPVIEAESRSNATVAISSDNKVKITGGNVTSLAHVGMDINGEIKANFQLDTKTKFDIQNGVIKIKI